MDTFQLRVFQTQVENQCRFILFSADDIRIAYSRNDTQRVFYSIQNLLNAGANISKMLWGQGGKFSDQRKKLRESIGISDTSPLRSVNMRNNFEHMDERIDRWWSESVRKNFADQNIGPKSGSIVGLEEIDMFRLFDPATAEIVFWGESFSLLDIEREVRRILPKLHAEARQPHWDEPGQQ